MVETRAGRAVRARRAGAVGFIICVALASCHGPASEEATAPRAGADVEASTQDDEPGLEDLAVERRAPLDGVEIDARIGPVAVEDGIAILRLEFEPTGEVDLMGALGDPMVRGASVPTGVQLVDLGAGTVFDLAWSDAGVAATTFIAPVAAAGAPVVLHGVYEAPEGDHVDVFVPGIGYIPDVPVVPAADLEEAIGLGDVTDAAGGELTFPTARLADFVTELGGELSTRTDDEGTVIAMDADVLFDKDSADLGPDADRVLERVVGRLSGTGELAVTGHTDDVGDRAYNVDLSERRARAVADALADRADLDGFDVVTEGRGYDEPAVPGTSEEARAANRRVEIEFVPAEPAAAADDGGELPEAAGPEGSADEGVRITDHTGVEYEIALPQLMRHDGHLVGEFELTNHGPAPVPIVEVLAAGGWDARGEHAPELQAAANKVTVLHGDTRVYPIDYTPPQRDYVIGGNGQYPLADRGVHFLEPDQPRIVTVVWPDIPGDVLTVDAPQDQFDSGVDRGGPPFRLTDVPVVDAP